MIYDVMRVQKLKRQVSGGLPLSRADRATGLTAIIIGVQSFGPDQQGIPMSWKVLGTPKFLQPR